MADNLQQMWDEAEPVAEDLAAEWDAATPVESPSAGLLEGMDLVPSLTGLEAKAKTYEQNPEFVNQLFQAKEAKAKLDYSDIAKAEAPLEVTGEHLRRALTGWQQLGIRLMESVGAMDVGSTEEFTVNEDLRRTEFDHKYRFMNPVERAAGGLAAGAMEMAALSPIPGPNKIRGIRSVKGMVDAAGNVIKTTGSPLRTGGRIAYSAGVGAGIGAGQYAESDDARTSNIIWGAVFSGGVDAGVEAYRLVRPHTIVRGLLGLDKRMATEVAKEGATLSAETKVPMHLSEVTGSSDALALESAAQRGFGLDGIVIPEHNKRVKATIAFLQDTLQTYSQTGSNEAVLGQRVKTVVTQAIDDVRGLRRDGWNADMGRAKAASKGQKFINTDALAKQLEETIKEKGHFLASKESKAVAKELRADLKRIKGGKLSVTDAQVLLGKYTEWGMGTGRILRDIDTAADTVIGKQLKAAVLGDLDTTIAKADPTSAAAIALKAARDNYANASRELDAIGATTIGQFLNRTNTPSVEKFARTFKDKDATEVTAILTVLNKHDPTLINSVRRQWVEDALEDATKDIPTDLPGRMPFNPEAFLKAVGADTPQFKAVFGKDAGKVLQGVALARRITDRASKGGGANATAEVTGAARNIISGSLIFTAGWVAHNVAPKAFARAFLTEEGINALKVAAAPTAYNPAQVTQALFFLKSLEDMETSE